LINLERRLIKSWGELRIENGKWRIENGKWRIENGKWRIENGKWKIENGEWRMENGECYLRVHSVNSVVRKWKMRMKNKTHEGEYC